MTDKITTIEDLKDHIRAFSKARGWTDNNPKDLVMALTVEAAELAEIFMWTHSDQADQVREDPREFEHLQEELADVFWYLLRVCDHFSIDLAQAVEEKTVKNALKYPAME